MKNKRSYALIVVLGLLFANPTFAKGDDFKSVVKLIEDFYRVKHEGLPFLAKAAMKLAKPVGRITGGDLKRLAEIGSVKIATFEGQEFRGDFSKFRSSLNQTLAETWTPLVQTMSTVDEEQVYLFVRESGDKFNVLVITIEPGDGTVVQATLSASSLAQILKDPEDAGKKLSREAAVDNNN
jgi:hypothetical protein